jgi:RimJ/RimL family protein N-acetyltransferase
VDFLQEAVNACAKYGFEELGLGVLWCGHDVGDKFSPQVMDDCGFTFRFERRGKRVFGDEKRMKYYYALTRQTYLAARQGEDGIVSFITTMF